MSTTGGQQPEPSQPTESAGSFDEDEFGDLSDSRVEVRIEEGSKEGSDYVITMRDGSKPDGPVLRFTPAEWDAFVAGVRDGEFDLDETGALVDLPEHTDDPAEPTNG
jgi:Domain of unknown function (DUF397)